MNRSRSERAAIPPRQTRAENLSSSMQLHFPDGSLEALKWIGLALMTGDHINKYWLQEQCVTLYLLGRMVMPLFGFVLMYNLARPDAMRTGVHRRVALRLAAFGALATPASVALVGGWPLNIMAMLLAATWISWLLETSTPTRRCIAVMVFLLGGAVVEFWWPGLLCCLGARTYVRRPGLKTGLAWAVGTASLSVVNGNWAALAALPMIWGFSTIDAAVGRARWAFYAFYPAHLSVIAWTLHLTDALHSSLNR